MKSALTVVLFRLFTIGVFVNGKESNAESVSLMEGDSVTLKSGETDIRADDGIKWMFSGNQIATISRDSSEISVWVKPDGPFKDRLQLNNQTRDLKISNIKTTDSGQYKLKISSRRGSSEKEFTVSVVPADGVKTVSVMEGDSVTLNTSLTEIQTDDVNHVIRWRFEHQNPPVAEINRMAGIFDTSDGPDERFGDRVKLDHQTGSLTIMNTRTTDSGLYEVDISSSRYTIHKSFSVTVSADVESVSVLERDSVTLHTGLTETQTDEQILWKFGDHDELITDLNETWRNIDLNTQTRDLTISNIQRGQSGHYKVEIITRRMILHRKYPITIGEIKSVSGTEGESVTLQIVTEVQNDDLIHWMFGDNVIAEIHKADRRFYTSDVPDERFSGRLKLDRQTGSLIIMNTRTTDSGDYQLKISSSRHTINRRFTVTVTGSGLSRGAVAGIVVGVLLAAAVVAGVVFYYRRKISELERPREENGGNHKKQDTDVPANEETELYSEEPIE